MKRIVLFSTLVLFSLFSFCQQEEKPIVLRTMGSLFFGGAVMTTESGETFHGDHGYAQYYIPQNSRTYPIVMWHGIGQSGKTYESTPDGREGYMSILPRHDWSVYIIDQPRRGRAGYTMSTIDTKNAVPTILQESAVWDAFRNGLWKRPASPFFFSKTQFPKTPYAVDQFFRQQTPDTGEEPRTEEHRIFMGRTMAQLLKQTSPAILITHSNSGQYGWTTAIVAPESVKALVAYEPGRSVFPENEIPEDITSDIEIVNEALMPQLVSMEEFKKLTTIPILIIFGDNIAKEKSDVFNSEVWRIASERAKQFVDAVNRHGGDAQLILLPELGIYGNTHAPFADLNNLEIAALLEGFLKEKGLAERNNPYTGPTRGQFNE
jgi:pimeloyl-ACP methyl ester carboxylesterase